MYARYQPLPISTGAVGIDRCGNIEVYAAPRVVHAPVRWGCWPIQSPYGWWRGWPMPPTSSCGCGGGCGGGLAAVLTGGAAMANWMIANRAKPPA